MYISGLLLFQFHTQNTKKKDITSQIIEKRTENIYSETSHCMKIKRPILNFLI